MVRLALLVLLLVCVSVARADDDDETIGRAPPGGGIPERLQELEREWADDVGSKEPDEAHDDTDADATEPPAAKNDDDETEAVKTRPLDDAPRPSPPSPLKRPAG